MIPDFQTTMRPLLELAADGKQHLLLQTIETLADEFELSPEEREEMLPSGKQRRFENRVRWARTHLGKAGLLEATDRGVFRITPRGQELLREVSGPIGTSHLDRYQEYLEFKKGTKPKPQIDLSDRGETPEETLEASYQTLRDSLAEELLQRVKASPPRFFEELVVDLLVAMGYGGSRRDAGQAVGKSGDGGIDGIINEDRLGLDVVYLQAKRWEGPVGRPIVQGFAGSLEGHRARKGVLITTSHFTADALDYVEKIEKRIVLVDGDRLAQLMIDHDIGVANVTIYPVKQIDLDYFPEDLQTSIDQENPHDPTE